jgi:hypothetical protein
MTLVFVVTAVNLRNAAEKMRNMLLTVLSSCYFQFRVDTVLIEIFSPYKAKKTDYQKANGALLKKWLRKPLKWQY